MSFPSWVDVDRKELLKFFAIVIQFGVVTVPYRRDAWSTGRNEQTWIKSVMSRNRFEQILRAFHWKDVSVYTAEQRKEMKRVNPFWRIAEFLAELSENFSKYFQLGQYIDIDEMSIPFKGRHICRCYNPKKPEKWHFKAFGLNDSVTGYLFSFYLYQGSAEKRPQNMPATLYPVYMLTRNAILHGINHILCLDNWYTRIGVFEMLRPLGIHVVGTVKVNKKGLPKEGIFKKSGHGKERG